MKPPVKTKQLTYDVNKRAVTSPSKPKISKLKGNALRTMFGERSEKILQLLESDDTDPAMALIYKRLLQSLVDILPMAELAIRASKGTRGIYQFNQLIGSTRELMTDIQSAQDRGMMGTALMESVVKPAFSDMANDIVQEYGMIGADAKLGMTAKEWSRFSVALKESRARLADKITKHYRRVNEETVSFLQR